MSESTKLLRFAAEGDRVRRAASALEQASPLLASALRRSMPFLAARGASVALSFARAMPVGDLLGDLQRPFHATHLVLTPSGTSGALILDAGAISTILDGVLGGDGRSPPKLNESGLSSPQAALVTRVVDGVVRSFSEVLKRKFGITLQATAPDADDAITEGAPVVCSLEFGAGDQVGRVLLLLAKEALLPAARSRCARRVCPGAGATRDRCRARASEDDARPTVPAASGRHHPTRRTSRRHCERPRRRARASARQPDHQRRADCHPRREWARGLKREGVKPLEDTP